MTLVKGSNYFSNAFDPHEIRERAKKLLKNVPFDTIVGTGMSGVMPLQVLGEVFECHTMIVRKTADMENSHCDSLYEGTLGRRWIIVDDMIATGATVARVWDGINRLCASEMYLHECLGAFLYQGRIGEFAPFAYMVANYRRFSDAVEGISV